MHKVKFTNFRCFADTPPIEIRPITFLVGENSAGKTSFLAGARYLMGCFARSPKNPFNSDPYYLGGFEQIAHYRGGRGGRAKGFSLSIDVAGDDPAVLAGGARRQGRHAGDVPQQRARPRGIVHHDRHRVVDVQPHTGRGGCQAACQEAVTTSALQDLGAILA